jgi:ABC-type transport system involved in cytochrome c biogenesis permease subunit
MSRVLKQQPAVGLLPEFEIKASSLTSYLPAALALSGAVALTVLRFYAGGGHFISDGALMMLALACYLLAAVFHLTDLYAPSELFQRLGLWGATGGVFFNLASWGVRWIAAYDIELEVIRRQGGAEMPWFFRYIPFANLYDLSLAFAFGAGAATLLIARRKNFRFLGAISLPLAALILVLARFIGGEIANLPPVLDSYWRPIHVGVASLSYGVALVCFALAVVYLLKDNVKTEAMAVFTSVFALVVFATVSRFSLFAPSTFGTYGVSTFLSTYAGGRSALPLKADLPYVGWFLVAAGALLAGAGVLFARHVYRGDETSRTWGHRLLKLALVAQGLGIVTLVSQVKSLTDVASRVGSHSYAQFGAWMLEQQGMVARQVAPVPAGVLEKQAAGFVQANGDKLFLSLNANPVELSALLTAFVGTLFVVIFSFKTERLRASLPSLEKVDGLAPARRQPHA